MDINDPSNELTDLDVHNKENDTYHSPSSYGVYCASTLEPSGRLRRSKNLYITDSYLFLDAPGCDAHTESSVGINHNWFNEVYITGCKIYATHTGVSGSGALFVRDSILSGFSHGGIYVTTKSYERAINSGFVGEAEDWKNFLEALPMYFKDTTLEHRTYPSNGIYS
jgi:hypothetical protein